MRGALGRIARGFDLSLILFSDVQGVEQRTPVSCTSADPIQGGP